MNLNLKYCIERIRKTILYRKRFDIILSTVFLFLGILIGGLTDISNKILKTDIIKLDDKINSTHKSQLKLEDQIVFKYQLLKDYFPKGYLVYRYMPGGEFYVIEYPGLWAVKSKYINIHKEKKKWYIDYFMKQVYSELNIKIDGNGIMSHTIDFTKHLEMQDVSLMIIDSLHFGLLLLDNDINAPVFAIGLTKNKNISKKIHYRLND